MRDRLVVANLKMQWRSREDAKAYLRFFAQYQESASSRVQMVLCGSFPFLERMRVSVPESISIGAQDLFWDDIGAYTGEVSGSMLRSIGVEYVLVGHSERRIYNEETDADVMQKLRAAIRSELIPIVCIGETKEERSDGRTNEVLKSQLEILKEVDWSKTQILPVIAYEPRWAIGGHQTPSREEIVVATGGIRSVIEEVFGGRSEEVRILYGGSVGLENVRIVSIEAGLDGILAGRVSLDPKVFSDLALALEE